MARSIQVTKKPSIIAGRQGDMLAMHIYMFKQRSQWWPYTSNQGQPKHNFTTGETTYEYVQHV